MTAVPLPHSEVQADLQLAHEFLRLHTYDRATAYTGYDLDHAINVARWYIEEAEPASTQSPTSESVEVYAELASTISYQFNFLTLHVGIDVDFSLADPYESSADMFDRFYSTGTLQVFKTQPGLHPIWSDDDNDRFRAVHDLLGHCAWANSFGPKGEDAAYLSHIATLPRWTWPALCSETRGQNATFNYGYLIDGRPAKQYARQSWMLSPEWVCA
jgi:hypothetical protein